MAEVADTSDIDIKEEEVKVDQSDTSTIRDDAEEIDDEESDEESNEDYNPFSDAEEEEEVKVPTENEYLTEDVRLAARKWTYLQMTMTIPSVRIEPSISGDQDMCAVVMSFNATKATAEMNDLWDLKDQNAVLLSIILERVHKWEYRTFDKLPTVLARIDYRDPSISPLGDILCNTLKPILALLYPLLENLPPAETGSLFEMLYEVLMDRLNTLNEYRRWCEAKLEEGGRRPSVCNREHCQFLNREKLKYLKENKQLCSNLVASVVTVAEGDGCRLTPIVSPPVLSLLMMTFNAAVNSERWEDILIPAPSASDLDQLAANVAKLFEDKKEWLEILILGNSGAYELYKVLGLVMPCALHILNGYKQFKEDLPSIAEFIDWLLKSNKSILHLVPPERNVGFFETKEQFLFIADDPVKRAEFDALVKKNGGKTRYMFYGSRMENWHSIIHSGFTGMSGATYQLMESLNGAGIYLSNKPTPFLSDSTSFTKNEISVNCWNKGCCVPEVKEKMALVAVVEVVDTRHTIPLKRVSW
ncbi:hypothetical protein PENTCL1PPCAC_2802 [Pristionchus entomophagus]|uniref:TLDc domain-containing protein n=1 Tax=Pristionchus entomophagus TaxID=358040 RepID=A0AAV5SDL9_9BILA|nr:hypothetical protein PENTCL1PPCAC_2802 [Pristionchus entomophagus]